PVSEVEAAFGLTGLPRPRLPNVAPNQVFPHKKIYLSWGLLSAAAIFLGILILALSPRRTVVTQRIQLVAGTGPERGQVLFSEPFQLQGRPNIQISARADLDNSWLDIEGDLINEDTGLIQSFYVPLSYYSGVEDGEAWSEGSRENSTYLSALPAGLYRL